MEVKVMENGYVRTCLLNDPRIKYVKQQSVERYVDLMSDVGFKLVFGKVANKELLIEFLNQVITDRRITDVEFFLDKEKHGMSEKDKSSIFDLYCITDDGSRVIVEVQKRMHDWYIERTLYYSTFPVQEQVSVNCEEYRICPVYVISILKTRLRGIRLGEQVRSCFRLYEETSHVLLTPVYNVIFLEMGKFRKSLSELDGSILDGFYFCLKNMVKLSERPVELQQDIFQRLFEVCRLSKMDKVEQIQYNKAMITEIDIRCFKKMAHKSGYAAGEKKGEKAGFEKGIKKGIKEGIKEGREEGQKIGQEIGLEIGKQNARVSIARQMKVKGYPVADISEMTGLPEDRIMAL